MPNKLSQFWQELKRRKVIKVIAMYAGAAYVLIELANNVAEPLNLPGWTPRLVIIIALVGFPIMVVLSWIFDITPEGIGKTVSLDELAEPEQVPSTSKRKLKANDVIIVVLFVIVVILAYPKIFGSGKSIVAKDHDGRISITVLPFENLTGDSLYCDWQVGVQNLLINSLSNSKEISVRQPETMSSILAATGSNNYTSITPSIGRDIASKLETNTYILGNILKAGNKLRIGAQLRNTSTQEIYRSYEVDGDSEDQIFMMADSLSNLLLNFLKITVLEKEADFHSKIHSETYSAEAYKYYIQGQRMHYYSYDNAEAIKLYNKALDKDSCFVSALVWISISYLNTGQVEQARLIQNRTERYIDQAPLYEQLYYSFFKALLDKDIQGSIKYAMRLTQEYPFAINTYYSLGFSYRLIQQYEKASDVFDQLFERMRQLDIEWGWIRVYQEAGRCLHKLGQHTKEQEVYENGLRVSDDHPGIIYRQAVCALSLDDTINANKLISKYHSVREVQGHSASGIEDDIGYLYEEAEYLEKAMKYYQLALEHEPDDIYTIWAMTDLAYLLIVNDLNVNEGMELIDRAFHSNPTNEPLLFHLYHSKGWGLHKQGNDIEALEYLNKAWDLRPFYDHNHFLHIQEVEQALTSQNR